MLKFIMAFIAFGSGIIHGTELVRSDITISRINPVSANRPNEPYSQDYIKVYINSASWGASPCRPDGFLISKSDTHLYATLLAGWTTGLKIDAVVENGSGSVLNGEWCKAVNISIYQ